MQSLKQCKRQSLRRRRASKNVDLRMKRHPDGSDKPNAEINERTLEFSLRTAHESKDPACVLPSMHVQEWQMARRREFVTI